MRKALPQRDETANGAEDNGLACCDSSDVGREERALLLRVKERIGCKDDAFSETYEHAAEEYEL